MVDLETIEGEIRALERMSASYQVCERLAWLYIVRDHIRRSDGAVAYGESDFLKACAAADYRDVLGVLDEHMDALMVLQPKEYESLMERLRSLTTER